MCAKNELTHEPHRHPGARHTLVTDFDALVAEAEHASTTTWDFGWLDGRAVEDRPSWRYFDLVAERVRNVSSVLEIQAGTGSMIGRLPSLPRRVVATEGFPASVAAAAPALRARGVQLVVTSQTIIGLPLARESFELVISRHPIEPWWTEIARVLQPGGVYLAQHVGPRSLRDLSEFLMGPLPPTSHREPSGEQHAAETAGLELRDLRTERTRVEFYDIGAVVYFLRLVPWIVPGFTVEAYRTQLRALHDHILQHGAFRTTSSRTLIEATKPSAAAVRTS